MREIDEVFGALGRSRFRSRIRLSRKDANYLREKGLETVLEHGREFIKTRLSPARPVNDGRQTPMRNHPVFVAQHATATCCRKCLEKWHKIPRGRALTEEEVEYIISIISLWLDKQEI